MSAARTWAVLSAFPPLAALALVLAENDRLDWVVRCTYRLPAIAGYFRVGAMLLALFALAVSLTFVTQAAGTRAFGPWQRFAWALALLVASPLMVPLYWFLYLRSVR